MSMFDNYPQPANYVPDNMHKFLEVEELDEIVIGGTATHIFVLDFLYSEKCSSYKIFYKQSLTDILELNNATIVENSGKTTITVTLTPTDTIKFNDFRDTFAQIKLFMKDGTVLFGETNKVIVKSTLDTTQIN